MEHISYIITTLLVLSFVWARKRNPHPLSRFPGPRLATWTWMYRAYYDNVVGGGWLSHLQKLHDEYGPVVRVGYNELHFAHPDAYVDIYASPVKLNKDPELYNTFKFGWSSNVFTSTDPKEHAALKSMLGTFFSRQCVLKLEYVIQERIDKLISQLAKNHKSLPADMNFAFRSVTLDIITLYSFRTSLDATTFPAFRHPAVIGVEETMSNIWALKHLSLLRHIVKRIPPRLAMRLSPSSKPVLEAQLDIERLAKQAIKDCSSSTDLDAPEERNVFHTLLSSGKLEHTRSTVAYLVSEGLNLRVAGSDTVGNACTIGTRSLIADDRVRAKLVDELEKAWPDKDNPMPLERLEKLPYLTAVIKESLRLSHGVVTPMTRVVPDSGAVIAGHPIPPGTIVSIANSFVNMSPEPFPEPTRFYPERWLEDKDRILERYLVSFGKGPRSCLGINLAWSELYMILGNVFRKLNFESQTDLSAEIHFKEFFVPIYPEIVLSATITERQ